MVFVRIISISNLIPKEQAKYYQLPAYTTRTFFLIPTPYPSIYKTPPYPNSEIDMLVLHLYLQVIPNIQRHPLPSKSPCPIKAQKASFYLRNAHYFTISFFSKCYRQPREKCSINANHHEPNQTQFNPFFQITTFRKWVSFPPLSFRVTISKVSTTTTSQYSYLQRI